MRVHRWDGVAVLSIGAACAVTAALYERLPDPLPTHFDLHGNPNGWMPRAVGAWFAPGIAFLLWVFLRYVARVLPRDDRKRMDESTVATVAMLTTVFIAAVHVLVLYVAVVPGVSVTRGAFAMAGVLFVALGLVLPRVRRNPIMGIRTAWTLTSDENWARTQRMAGYTMVGGGIAGGLAGMLGGPSGGALAIACFLLAAIVPAVYSFVLARRAH